MPNQISEKQPRDCRSRAPFAPTEPTPPPTHPPHPPHVCGGEGLAWRRKGAAAGRICCLGCWSQLMRAAPAGTPPLWQRRRPNGFLISTHGYHHTHGSWWAPKPAGARTHTHTHTHTRRRPRNGGGRRRNRANTRPPAGPPRGPANTAGVLAHERRWRRRRRRRRRARRRRETTARRGACTPGTGHRPRRF